MTRPPEITEYRTETQRLEDAIVKACTTIRRAWPDMLDANAQLARRQGGSRSAGILADHSGPDGRDAYGRLYWLADNTDASDVDAATRLVALREWVTQMLNSWCRLVMEDRPVTAGKALPDGRDVPDMCAFLERHAQWLSGHEAAPEAQDELEDIAAKVLMVVDPYRKEWHKLGECRFYLHEEGRFCTGTVRIHVGADDDEATCTDCGQTGPIAWWEEVLDRLEVRYVPALEMARILHARLHLNVTDRTVRNWAREKRIDGRLAPRLGPSPDGAPPEPEQWWFNVRVVVAQIALMDRECPMCGRLWSGEGKVCGRCWEATHYATATYGDESPAYPVVPVAPKPRVVPPDYAPEERLTDEKGKAHSQPRCVFSDMPMRWCGCGRRHVVAS